MSLSVVHAHTQTNSHTYSLILSHIFLSLPLFYYYARKHEKKTQHKQQLKKK